MKKDKLLSLFALVVLYACSPSKQISRSAQTILKDSSLSTAHVGISIYEPASDKYWFDYQGDHYFVPASNTKIPTCYAAMKYLGDSLGAVWKLENDTAIFISPHGDPTLLHPDFLRQPLIELMKNTKKKIFVVPTKC